MRIPENSFLKTTPIAHRGLHDVKKGIPENSYAAYQAAIDKNYAIEIDIRFSKDGKIVVFHDDDLDRLTNGTGKVFSKTYDELLQLNLQGTNEKIPEFSELLQWIDGRAPLLIELKNTPEKKDLVKQSLEILKDYKGEFALQSFNPVYLYQIKRQAPHVLRGQLAFMPSKNDKMPKIQYWTLKRMPLHFLTKPDFISYSIHNLPNDKIKKKAPLLLGWTARCDNEYLSLKNYVDNVIFENISPEKL